MGRGFAVLFAATFLVAGVAPSFAQGGEDLPSGLQAQNDDVLTWAVGDTWSYHIYSYVTDGSDWGAVYSWTDTTVAAVETVTQNGQSYDVYNVTLSGTVITEGVVTLGIFRIPFNLTTGTVSGYVWVERGDGSIVRNSETANAAGYADLGFPFGQRTIQVDGSMATFHDPPREQYDFPLLLGDEWLISTSTRTMGYQHYYVDLPPALGGPIDQTSPVDDLSTSEAMSWFNATANVSVPAGDFTSRHLHSVTTANDPNPGLVTDLWYSPLVRNVVRSEAQQVLGPQVAKVYTNLTAFSLNSQPYDVQISLEPNPVNPGGLTFANVTTEPDAQVTLSVPFAQDVYVGTSDATGFCSFNVSAPLSDDNTPANADQGSHGVVVDVQSGPLAAWNASTIILRVPDMWVEETEVAFTPFPLADGVATDIQAVVHSAPWVGVHNPVEVRFSVDGAPVGVQTLPSVPENASVMVSAAWAAPTAGAHTVEVTVDPASTIPETDEGNNTAWVLVYVEAPDLTLVNISARGGQYQYADAASAGFLSEPIGLNPGETVDLNVTVLNAGTATPWGAGYELAFYNVTGPGGPPAGGPFAVSALWNEPPPGMDVGPLTAPWTAPTAPGDYYVNATVDFYGDFNETDEGNNSFTFHLVVDGPDYVPTDFGGSPLTVTEGGTVDISVRVLNQGSRAAQWSSVVAFYEGSEPGNPFHLAAVDPLSPGESSGFYNATWTASAAGPHNLTVEVDYLDDLDETEEGNNTATIPVEVMAPPVSTLTLSGPQVGSDPPTITDGTLVVLSVQDRSGSGIAGTFYRVDGGAWTDYGVSGPFALIGDGLHTIQFNSTDNLGGAERTRAFVVAVDTTPPETALVVGEPKSRDSPGDPWRVTDNTTLALEFADLGDGAAGVDFTEYRVDGGGWTAYVSPFTLAGLSAGRHTVEFRSVDLLGNAESPRSAALTLEESPPEGPGETAERSVNLKPVLAAAFALVLIVAAWRAGSRPGRNRRRLLIIGGVFAVVEAATGAASLGAPALAMPPWLGAGLAVDVGLLILGLAAILKVSKTAPAASEEEE